jgi:hypothetical protein
LHSLAADIHFAFASAVDSFAVAVVAFASVAADSFAAAVASASVDSFAVAVAVVAFASAEDASAATDLHFRSPVATVESWPQIQYCPLA